MRSRKFYRALVFILILASPAIGFSQTPFLKHIPLFKGKENYTVNVVYQDRTGLIWFGTNKGLFKYDGINLDQFTSSDSLAHDNITSMAESQSGVLWIGHGNGKLSKFENNSFSVFRPEEGLGTVKITDIVSDDEGNIWYSTYGEGLYKYDGRHISGYNSDDGLSDDYVYDLEFDLNGTLWLATDYGITKYTSEETQIISMKDGLPDNIVRVIKAGTDGRLWLGTDEKGISVYDPKNASFITINGWNFGSISGFAMNLNDELWVSTSKNGIIKLNFDSIETDPSYQQITKSQGLITEQINTILKDQENNIWIAGKEMVIQALPPVFEFLNRKSGTPFDMVYSFTIDMDDNYWVCSEYGLFKGVADDYGELNWVNVSEEAGLISLIFNCVYAAPDGSIWTGTYGMGIIRFTSNGYTYRNYSTRDGLLNNDVINISGAESHIWLSTVGGGVSYYDLESKKITNFKNESLNNSYIYSALEDNSGKTWVAGTLKSPAFILDNAVHFLPNTTIAFPQLYSIAIDSSDNAWFNTNDKGIICIREDTIKTYGELDGISFKEIQSIVFDKWDNLVIISNEGIIFYSPDSGVQMEFGENTGLAYQYPILNSVYTDKKERIWIGTETGLIRYNPNYLSIVRDSPRIFLSTLELFGEPLDSTNKKYKYNENNFTFGYTGLYFKNPEGLSYRYKLDGYDLDWLYSKRNEPLTYSKLPAGKFSFVAQVSLDGKNWVAYKASTYSFTVMPPFWFRWWFIVTVIILIIAGVYLYIKQRLANLKKAKDELELEVLRRTEEIRMQNEELETQKEEIAAQRDNAEQQRDQIEQQSEEIQASIRYAQRIQAAALPPKSFLDELLGEHFVLNKPRDIVSGDFYWAAKREEYIFFVVGDCTGHGVPGAFMSMLGLSALNDIVKSLDVCKASQVLDLLDDRIRESLHQGSKDGTTSQDGMDISLCIYEPATGSLQFAAAHNSLYIINNDEVKRVRADSMGIGSYSEIKQHFTNHVLQLKQGDIIYMFSDGYPDQFGGPEGKKYKYKQFREFLVKIHKEDMGKQRELLDEEIENWRNGSPQIDDILVMGFKKM